jgi:hypothetical protein
MRDVIAIPRFFQERAKLAGMSRRQSAATNEQIETQRTTVRAARSELLLDQHIAALVADAHELTEEQRTRIRLLLRG